MTAIEIKGLLRARYRDPREWIYFEECPTGTGYISGSTLDAYVIACWPSAKNNRIAFEIKVSRSDFLSEKKKPLKRRAGLLMSNEFYFVAPKGMIKIEELPPECGLMEVDLFNGALRLGITVKAPQRESIRPTWNLVATLLRRYEVDIIRKLGERPERQLSLGTA
jgi:hypothetical protein